MILFRLSRLPVRLRCALSRSVGLALGAAFSLVGCVSNELEANTLPFHVAVVPFGGSEATRGEAFPGSPAGFRLQLDEDRLAEVFVQYLDELSFTEVSLLSLPAGVTSADFSGWSADLQSRHWVDAAEAQQADLIMQADLRYDPLVHSEFKGSKLWAMSLLPFNLSLRVAAYTKDLYALLGLSLGLEIRSWRRADRSYYFDLSLEGGFHEVGALRDPASRASLANNQAELSRFASFQTQETMTFLDRSNGVDKALTLLLPAALLAGDKQVEHRSLREKLAENALRDLMQQIAFRRDELIGGGGLYAFTVEGLQLTPNGDESWQLSADVILSTQVVDVMDGYRIWVDGELALDAALDVPTAELAEGENLYHLDARLPRMPWGSRVRLEVRDGALRQGVRTFTFSAGRTGSMSSKSLDLDLEQAL